MRDRMDGLQRYHLQFEKLIGTIPEARAGVFIRYKPNHNPHANLLWNTADLNNARVLRAHDRGPDNRNLMTLIPDRVWYLFDERTFSLRRIQ